MSFFDHLATGATTLCRCWALHRRDGSVLGCTDHDKDLTFEGIIFRADSGMSARAFQQSTGLAVDNSEAIGALSDEAITEADIEAGRFDAARVTMWMVNWSDPVDRSVRFSGSIGEIVRAGSSFRAELRGLTETLNKPQGLVFQRTCSAVLGDRRCRVNLDDQRFWTEISVENVLHRKIFLFDAFPPFQAGWFERGSLSFLDGEARGLGGHIKIDRAAGAGRRIVLWQELRATIAQGDRIRLTAGCDKRPETCMQKFSNFLNFRGFPTIPGEDWLMAYPSERLPRDGGRL